MKKSLNVSPFFIFTEEKAVSKTLIALKRNFYQEKIEVIASDLGLYLFFIWENYKDDDSVEKCICACYKTNEKKTFLGKMKFKV